MDPVGQLHINERPLAQRVEAQPIQPVDVQVPRPVGACPNLQHRQAKSLLPHLFQRRELGRERDDEMVPVRAHVIQGGVVGIGGKEVLNGLVGEDVALLYIQSLRVVAGILR